MNSPVSNPTRYKLWYVHQVGGPIYEQEIDDPAVGQVILDTIYQVALYQFNHNMIPDYANTGGISYFDADEGEWLDVDDSE